MKRKITLSVDEEVYDSLEELPRRVSVSEIVTWFLKYFVEEFKKGRELTQEEFDNFMNFTPGGRDFRERLKVQHGDKMKKLIEFDKKYVKPAEQFAGKVGRPPKKKV